MKTHSPSHSSDWRLALCAVLTALALYASFAPLEWSPLVWVALVPMLAAARLFPRAKVLRFGFYSAFLFWLLSLRWLTHVTIWGWLAMSAYCALYMLPVFRLAHRWRGGAFGFALLLSIVWLGFEFLRGLIGGGFPWNPLGVAVAPWLPGIQLAEIGGVWLVSALIVFANALIAWTIVERKNFIGLAAGALVVSTALGWGAWRLRQLPEPERLIWTAMVQPAIPQDDKWMESKANMIYARLRELTRAAQRYPRTELIIWPEAALPDELRHSTRSYDVVSALIKRKSTPLLTGTLDADVSSDGDRYYNSAFLFDADARFVGKYDKRHLVAFGEFIPLGKWVPMSLRMALGIGLDITPGTGGALFRVGEEHIPMSPLICFEDILPYLSRADVRSGARLLVNLTNDAWFDDHIAPRQHMRNAVLRAVENRVPLIRAANTGVSCLIDHTGAVSAVLEDEQGRTWMPGVTWAKVYVPPDTMPLTIYTRYGDMYAVTCSVLAVLWLLGSLWHIRRIRRLGGI